MDKEIKKLVNKLTGFREGSENLKRTVQFVQSNFRFHRFLDPDSHKITRTLEGIQEKLLIHSEPEKAAALCHYVTTILNSPLSESSELVKTEAHYAVLSFLLQLSNSPIHSTVQERRPEPKKAAEPVFDWTGYLLEGLPPVRSFRDSSEEEWSDEESIPEDGAADRVLQVDDVGNCDEGSRQPFVLSTRWREKGRLYGAGWDELSDRVVVQYWNGLRDQMLHSQHSSHQVTAHWNEIERTSKPFPTHSETFQMTESQIIRESIWVLLGSSKSFLYQMNGDCYTARHNVQVSHLTPALLNRITRQLAEFGTKVLQLQAFIDRVRLEPLGYCRGQRSKQRARPTSVSSEKEAASPQDSSEEAVTSRRRASATSVFSDRGQPLSDASQGVFKTDHAQGRLGEKSHQEWAKPSCYSCQTYEAFADALCKFLSDFRDHLVREEKRVVVQEETYTLEMFLDWLRSWLPLVDLAHDVFRRGVAEVETEVVSHRVSSLVHVLHEAIKEHYCLGFEAKNLLDLLWHLWAVTTRPYIQFITKWLTDGVLCDPAQEFAIHRNQHIHIKSENFWSKAFSLQSLPAPTDEADGAALSQPVNQRAGLSQPANRRAASLGGSTSRRGVSPHTNAVPEFLQPVLPHILLAGKSMEILEATGKLSRADLGDLANFSTLGAPRNLSRTAALLQPQDPKELQQQQLAGSVLPSLRSSTIFPPSPPPSPPREPARAMSQACNVNEVVERQLSLKGYHDPLIARDIADIGPAENLDTLTDSLHDKDGEEKEMNDSGKTGNPSLTKPLELVLYRDLYPAIITRCQSVCAQLATVLKEEFKLQDHLLCLRRFLLLEAGDVMYDFYSKLFSKVRRHEAWQDPLSLNYQFQETLSTHYPEEANRIMVSLEPQTMTGKMATHPIHALDCLTLHYKVPWPVDLIINQHSIELYNQVFRFLLQVKRAQYCLQQLRFPDLTRSIGRGSANDSDEEAFLSRGQLTDAERGKLPLIHRLFILRFKLLHFVNAVHNYLMTRILYSTGLEFSVEVDQASDLDQILAAHWAYLGKISERCLLHHKVAFVREAVTKVLNLALTFQRRWDAGVQTFSDSNVAKAEEEFYNCKEFLATLLANIIRRGTFPHLEALALSLSAPKPKGKTTDAI